MNKQISTEVSLGIIIVIVIILGVAFWFSGMPAIVNEVATQPKVGTSKIQKPLQPVDTAGWLVYRDKNLGLEFQYPKEMNVNKLLMSEDKDVVSQGSMQLVTNDSLREMTKENTKNKQCGPNMCPDDKIIDENFDILSKSAACPYVENFKAEVKNSYQLFSGLLDRISLVDGIRNDNMKICILKTIGSDGGSATVDTLYYRASFLNNGKAYAINFPVFPLGILQETDDYLIKQGIIEKDSKNGDYVSGNGDELSLFENFLKNPMNDPVGQKNIRIYDAIISTLKFSK